MAVSSNSSNKLNLLSLFCLFALIILGLEPKVDANGNDDDLKVDAGYRNAPSTCNANLRAILPPPYSDLSSLTCSPIWNQMFSFSFFQDSNNVTTIVLSGRHEHRWIGIGLSEKGKMVGSSAMVAWVERDGATGIRQYHLEGKKISEVIPDKGNLHFTSAKPAVVVREGFLYIAFQVQFPVSLAFQPILLAIGSGNPLKNGLLPKHINSSSTTVEFSSAHLMGQPIDPNDLRRYHGATAIIGWGILTPAGGMIARYFRHMEPTWYYLHSSTQFIGFFVGIISVALGRNLYQKIDAIFKTHKVVGYCVFTLAGLEVCQFVGRPPSGSKLRQYWNFGHYWVGRAAIVLGVVNIFIGFYGIEADRGLKVSFVVALATLFATGIFLQWRMRRQNSIPGTIDQPPVFQVDKR